jgi:hypothetical protein
MKKYIITTIAAIFAAFTTSNANVTGSLEVNHTTNYTFRGQILDTNPTVVPKLTLNAPLAEGVKLVGTMEQVIGTRGSALFRSQYNLGVEVKVGRLAVTPGYEIFSFPNIVGVADTQIATLRFDLDDAGLVLPFGLNPYVDLGKGVSANTGTRAEVGIRPKLTLGKLDVSVPIAAGFSHNAYYPGFEQNVRYAYTTVGVAGEYHVTDRLSVKGLVAGYNTDSKLGNGSNNFITTNLGVAVSF